MEQQTSNKKIYITIAMIVMVVLGFYGYQWYQKNHFKNLLQKEFNRQYQNWGRGSFCYIVGDVHFPYIDRGVPAELMQQRQQLIDRVAELYQFPNYSRDYNQYQLNRLLPIYHEAGLLSRQLVEGEEDYYQYDLTELGKKYQSEYDDELVFCYGYQKVQDVIDISKRDSNLYPGKKYVDVTYNYEVDDLPDWVNHEHFRQAYSLSEQRKVDSRSETFIEGNEGVFIDGLFNSHIYPPQMIDFSW